MRLWKYFADAIRDPDQSILGRVIWVWRHEHRKPVKVEEFFLWLVVEEEVSMTCSASPGRSKNHVVRYLWGPRGEKLRAASGWQRTGKWEPQSCNHKEVNPANNHWAWSRAHPRQNLQKETHSRQHLDFSLGILSTEPSHAVPRLRAYRAGN